MSDDTMFERAWRNEGPQPWKDPFEAIRDVVGIPPNLLTPTQIEANLSTMLGTAGRIEIRARQMGRTLSVECGGGPTPHEFRNVQSIRLRPKTPGGNWRRRQARQERRRIERERRKREAIMRMKHVYAEAAKEFVSLAMGPLSIARKLFRSPI